MPMEEENKGNTCRGLSVQKTRNRGSEGIRSSMGIIMKIVKVKEKTKCLKAKLFQLEAFRKELSGASAYSH